MGVRCIYLVRHGDYLKKGKWGTLGPPLTLVGRKQAMRVAKRLSRQPIKIIHASTMIRARETADIIAKELSDVPVKYHNLLWEGAPTPIPGYRTEPEYRPLIAKTKKRMDRVYEKYFRPSRSNRFEILVGHGNLIRYLVLRSLGTSGKRWYFMGIHCCGISCVVVLPSEEKFLISFNETGHLPKSLLTHS
ncbi:MAG: histidine phosphatase family protein [Planctomycetota bacterium]